MGDDIKNASLVHKAVELEPYLMCSLHPSRDFSKRKPKYLCSFFAHFLWIWGQILGSVMVSVFFPYFKKTVSLIVL